MPKHIGADDLDAIAASWRTYAGASGRIVGHLISGYTAGDNYATVVAASLGSVNLAATDITSGAGSSNARTITIAAKAITLTAGHAGTTLHYAVVDTVSGLVRGVTTATSDVTPVVSGGVWNNAGSPIVITIAQPT